MSTATSNEKTPGQLKGRAVGWETVSVFVSSTFNDMHAERDYLVKEVFPSLREWCERRKLRLVDVDLRWGVTDADATNNKRVVRDVDDDGKLLWIPDSKTKAGRRTQEVPEVLQPYLLGLVAGREPEALLFGAHWRDWPKAWVKRICKAAKVPVVTAHGMRGLHSTLATDRGISAHAVAAALGHESPTTTMRTTSLRGRWRIPINGG